MFQKVTQGSPRFQGIKGAKMQLNKLGCSKKKLHAVKEVACSLKRLHAVTQACMQLNKLACNYMSLHAGTLACMHLHRGGFQKKVRN